MKPAPFIAAGLLLAIMAALMWNSASVESQTYDEGTHLGSGYSYWRTGDFRLNPEHPPLTKLLQAAPLLALDLTLPLTSDTWHHADGLGFGNALLYHQDKVPAGRLLTLGRSVTMLLALLLGATIFLWTRASAGMLAGIIALALYALDPNFIAHGHYITSDVAVSLAIFVSAVTWLRYLDTGTPRHFWFAAIALGLAAATKFSALYLIPIHIAIAVARRSSLTTAKRVIAVTAIAAAIVASSYGPATVRAFLANPRKPLATLRDNHPYAIGIKTLWAHNDFKQPAYLLGENYKGGRWQYFPVVFLVKTPAAGLLALLLLLASPALLRRHLALLIYPAAYFAITMAGDINLGIRHILPVYPFLYALAGIGIAQLKRGRVPFLALLALIASFEVTRIHPDHVAFFNLFAGGPANGPNLLLDSNLDWGQDLGKLKTFLAAHGTDTVALQYFGSADPGDYGIRAQGLPGAWEPDEIAKLDGWAAISQTLLHDVYFEKPTYTWLRDKQPVARIGRSILVYDLRKSR